MKRNIDLTIDRDFSINRNRNEISDIYKMFPKLKYPWTVSDMTHSVHYMDKSELVLTGNKTDREYKRKNTLHYKYCSECCELLPLIPWHQDVLDSCCSNCKVRYESMYRDYWKYPWENYNQIESLNISQI